MKRSVSGRLFLAASVLLFLFLLFTAQKPGIKRESSYFYHPSNNKPTQTLYNTNNIAGWIQYDGLSGHNPFTNEAGVWYPRGTANVFYQEGVVWGGYVHDNHPGWPALRVGGSTYRSGMTPGWIVIPGDGVNPPQAINPVNHRVRIYRIRRDWQSLTVNDLEVVRDAAELYNIDPSQVTIQMAQMVINQYAKDWQEWPGDLGAPFYDRNGNNRWDAGIDRPGLQNADQVIWFVCNDLDSIHTYDLYGAPTMGLELQVTIWAYKSGGPFAQTNLRRYRMINKSGFKIDSLYVAQWSDPEIGNYADDLVGCDSLLNLGFGYNGYPTDRDYKLYGLPPASVGYITLQGPIVVGRVGYDLNRNGIDDAQDFAIFNFESIGPGFINLPMTSFGYHGAGSPFGGDPELGRYRGTREWYNLLRGFSTVSTNIHNPIPYQHEGGPLLGRPTKFPLNGDPLSGVGDIDGQDGNQNPGDRLMAICSGPFTMQPSDTQEVIFALVGGIRLLGDNLTSLAAMKKNVGLIKTVFEDGFRMPYYFAPQIATLDGINTRLSVQLDLTDYTDVNVCQFHFSPQFGSEADFDLSLFDDGNHEDSLAGDGIWGNSITVRNRKHPYKADLVFNTPSRQYNFEEYYSLLALRPEPQFSNWRISWENGKQDGKINYNERVHLSFEILNRDHLNAIDSLKIYSPQNELFTFQHLPAGQLTSAPNQYIAFTAPAKGESVTLYLEIHFDGNRMTEKLTFPLQEWYPDPLQGEELDVIAISGVADHLNAIIADPTLLTGHIYEITFLQSAKRSSNDLWWRLTDKTAAEIKLDYAPLADRPNFSYPIVDGIQFQVFKADTGFKKFEVVANAAGAIDPPEMGCFAFNDNGFPLLFNNIYPEGTNRPDGIRQQTNGSSWGIHTGTTTANDGSYDYFKLQVSHGDSLWHLIIPYDFEIRFTNAGGWGFEPNAYVTGDPIGGIPIEVPFELWNIGINTPDDPSDDYRLFPYLKDSEGDSVFNIAPIDHPVSGGDNDPETDFFYWLLPADQSPGEAGYEAIVNEITTDPANHEYLGPLTAGTEVMRRMVLVNWNGGDIADPTFPANVNALMPEPGTVFRITAIKPNTPFDTLRVVSPVARPDSIPPQTTFLFQNYPNPFNDQTIIPFYLPQNGELRLEIFDVLGRRVKTVLKGKMEEGYHDAQWDGRNDLGVAVSSGLYFYRIKVGSFVQTRKLILLR